jgi:hypothetical protein
VPATTPERYRVARMAPWRCTSGDRAVPRGADGYAVPVPPILKVRNAHLEDRQAGPALPHSRTRANTEIPSHPIRAVGRETPRQPVADDSGKSITALPVRTWQPACLAIPNAGRLAAMPTCSPWNRSGPRVLGEPDIKSCPWRTPSPVTGVHKQRRHPRAQRRPGGQGRRQRTDLTHYIA